MNNLDVNGNQAATPSEPEEVNIVPFRAMMDGLAFKVQAKNQPVREFAAVVESAVLHICQQYPQEMPEERVAEMKRMQFYNGLKRTYRKIFVHMYENESSFEEMVDAILVVEEALTELKKTSREMKTSESHLPTESNGKSKQQRKKKNPWGWARTGLEPEVFVYVNDSPLDAILDLGCTVSFIDQEIVNDLSVRIKHFGCTASHCVSIGASPAKISNAILTVLGCIEIELGILGMGSVQAKLWVVKSMIDRGVPLVIGSNLIKKVFEQANLQRVDCWQQPWKFVYEGYLRGSWRVEECSEELSTSDGSFEILHNHFSPCPSPRCSTPSEEVILQGVKKQIAQSNSSALKGIPGPLEEPDGQEDSTPAALKGLFLPEEVEGPPSRDDDEQSVFADLAQKLDMSAAEAEIPPCNSKVIAQAALSSVRLPPFPAVSCKIPQLVKQSSACSGNKNKVE